MIGARLSGGAGNAFVLKGRGAPEIVELTPLHFLSTPGLWIGLVVAVAFFVAAVRLRRSREPI
jgi:ABC-2 type transport system permease protein